MKLRSAKSYYSSWMSGFGNTMSKKVHTNRLGRTAIRTKSFGMDLTPTRNQAGSNFIVLGLFMQALVGFVGHDAIHRGPAVSEQSPPAAGTLGL